MRSRLAVRIVIGLATLGCSLASAQLAGLPAPRLLTIMPMGGKVGSTVDLVITGTDLDEPSELRFSNPKITAKAKTAADGKPVLNQFTVTLAPDAPVGLHEVRVLTRLGISTPRAFAVGTQTEITRAKANTTPETALELAVDTVCNATVTAAAADHYTFLAKKGQKLSVDCVAAAIDSKLIRVLTVADPSGQDLIVSRRGGAVDFTAPADGKYFVRVNSLTYEGGPEHFYRLALLSQPPSTPLFARAVSSFSWTRTDEAPTMEKDPNDQGAQAQKITLPCDIAGRFFPAADVDTFEFEAKKGESWWIEVASHRLGLSTDPFVVVQRVAKDAKGEKLTDLAELNDIANPATGTPYDAGSSDVLGKFDIKEDGLHRLQLRDLFGGTRVQPQNRYRLIIRKAAPDFALVATAFDAPNGPNYAQAPARPLTLRGGGTLALQVAALRKDGFADDITLEVAGLPEGVTATGLKIPVGKATGYLLLTAAEKAPRGVANLTITGKSGGLSRPCQIASVVWPVTNTAQEIPRTRLHADIPVSVSGFETSPLTMTAAEERVFEAKVGEKLKIPMKLTWRGEHTSAIKLKAIGAGFETLKEIDVAQKAATASVELDLAALKLPAGAHTFAFHATAKGKYLREPQPEKKVPAKDFAEIVLSQPVQILIKAK